MKKIKDILLTITFLLILGTFGKLLVDSETGRKQVKEFNFPSEIPLKNWQPIDSKVIKNETKTVTDKPYEQILAEKKYYYQKDDQKLEIKMTYVVGTLGKAKTKIPLQQQYTRNLTPEQISPEWTKKDNLQYAILDYQDKSYLISCINSRGGSSVTSDEFRKKRIQYDLKNIPHLFDWLIGGESLLDRRCLWAELSLPLNKNNSSKDNHKLLESTWFNLYDWGDDNFPKITN